MRIWRKLLFLLRRGRFDHDLEEEIRLHLEMKARAGGGTDSARHAAQRNFGNAILLREISRDTWGWGWLETLVQDLRYAIRMLRRSPGFTVVAVLTLALGVGANTAVFSVVNTVLLRPLPYPESERLVQMWSTNPNANRWGTWVAYPRFVDWRRQSTSFEEMAAVRTWVINLSGGDHPEALFSVVTSSRLFNVLRVQPMLGRTFLQEEDQPGHDRVIVLSYSLWQRRFSSDGAVIGRAIDIDRHSYTVIGVMPRDFRFPPNLPAAYGIDAWLPPAPDPSRDERVSNNYYIVARLKPGVTAARAQAEMDAINHGLAEQHS